MQNWITFSVPGSDNFKEQTAHGRILIILLSVKVSLLSQDLNNFWWEMSKLLLLMRSSRHQIPCNLGEDFLSHIVLNCKNKRIVKLPHAAMKLKDTCSLEGRSDKPRKHIRKWDITLLTKVHIIKAMVFPVVTYGCDIWTIKKAEDRSSPHLVSSTPTCQESPISASSTPTSAYALVQPLPTVDKTESTPFTWQPKPPTFNFVSLSSVTFSCDPMQAFYCYEAGLLFFSQNIHFPFFSLVVFAHNTSPPSSPGLSYPLSLYFRLPWLSRSNSSLTSSGWGWGSSTTCSCWYSFFLDMYHPQSPSRDQLHCGDVMSHSWYIHAAVLAFLSFPTTSRQMPFWDWRHTLVGVGLLTPKRMHHCLDANSSHWSRLHHKPTVSPGHIDFSTFFDLELSLDTWPLFLDFISLAHPRTPFFS